MINKNWKLKDLRIDLRTYGPDEGKYLGRIVFTNGETEEFTFGLKPEQTQAYIDLIAKELVVSLGLLPKQNILIETKSDDPF